MGTIRDGIYRADIDLTNLNKMKEVKVMGNRTAKETAEMVYALAKLISSAKAAKENDGEITAGDAMLFVDDVLPLISGVTGADKIMAEFLDGYDEADQAEISAAWSNGSELHQNDDKAVKKALEVVYKLNELLTIVGVIAPSAPSV